jgi:putative mRNA 3-end processing factor
VETRLARGPVLIHAHRGTIQRALQLLSDSVDCPFLASPLLCAEAQLYRQFGYPIGTLLTTISTEGQEAIRTGKYIRFFGVGDHMPVQPQGTVVKLSAYFTRPDEPVVEYSERAYGVALSNHADFIGTLEYVKASGAQFVVTDNSRGGRGVELALALRERLGVEAVPSSSQERLEWGL